MNLKWHFRDKQGIFSEVPVFTPTSRWQPLLGHPVLRFS